MQLEELAHTILFGDRWEDKLRFDEHFEDTPKKPALVELPRFPGRPARLARRGKADFPGTDRLHLESARGQLLHFFANHELLAMELMALMLLKFPEAPKPFREGVARTIGEEQNHLRLYVDRMRELGVDFGELPVNDYFWNAMKEMASPLQFVIQMSLTFEQANLDFSLFYQRAIAAVGDSKTAAILERVYREEIGHVKHGVTWFNRWRATSGNAPDILEDDWEAYLRLLPAPMTARRARGPIYAAEARRQCGLSDRFIRELEVYAGSKGRPPVFWLYNPLCDAEIVRGKPGLSPPEPVRRLGLDLETLPMYLALETDVVLVQEIPRAEWLKQIREMGFAPPEFRRLGALGEIPREMKISGVEPWGWSPEPFERFKPWRDRLISIDGANGAWSRQLLESPSFTSTGIEAFFSKAWSVGFLREWLRNHPEQESIFGSLQNTGEVFSTWESAEARLLQSLAEGQTLLAKAPWGTSGTQNKRVLRASELASTLGGWIRNIIETQGAIILEPWLEKLADLSLQIEVSQQTVRVLGIRRFVNGSRLEYRGTQLDSKLSSLSSEALRFLHSEAAPLERWRELAQVVGEALRANGYQGPAGIDAMVWRDKQGALLMKPLVELNPRWTMGRLALELEAHLAPGAPARWTFVPLRELSARGLPSDGADAAKSLETRHPVTLVKAGATRRINQGVVFTTDPRVAREMLTILAVGAEALSDSSLRE